jgi:hypothetical protein
MTGIGGIVAGIGFRAVAGKAIANAKSDFAAIPPKVKLALLAIALLAVAVIVHQRFAHKAIRAAELAGEATGEARANAAWSAQVRQAKAAAETARLKAEALSRSIANQERTRHEEALRRDAADAGTLLLRGPGAAAGRRGPVDHPGVPAGAGGHLDPAAKPDDPGRQMPSGDWALVPWSWLVSRAQEHDDILSEAVTWRRDHARQSAAWQQLKAGDGVVKP